MLHNMRMMTPRFNQQHGIADDAANILAMAADALDMDSNDLFD